MSPVPSPSRVVVTPEPTDEELAAILLAHEALWPPARPAVARASSSPWRFSGRWWCSAGTGWGGWT